MSKIILASGSKVRRVLFECYLDCNFAVFVSHIDETALLKFLLEHWHCCLPRASRMLLFCLVRMLVFVGLVRLWNMKIIF